MGKAEILEAVNSWADELVHGPIPADHWSHYVWKGYVQEACNMFNFAYQYGMRGEWSPIVSWGRYG